MHVPDFDTNKTQRKIESGNEMSNTNVRCNKKKTRSEKEWEQFIKKTF